MLIFNEQMQEYSRNNLKSEETEISSFNAAFDPELSKSFADGFKYPDDTEDESEEQIEETVMPVEFYQNFDTFLNKCPPRLKIGQSLPSDEKSSHAVSKVSVKPTMEEKKKKKSTVSDAGVFVTGAIHTFEFYIRHDNHGSSESDQHIFKTLDQNSSSISQTST